MKKQKIINKKRLLMALKRHNRVGCSDKKLLWRANLYVDDQASDWNNEHPWVYDNEWNYDYSVVNPEHENQYTVVPLDFRYKETFSTTLEEGDGDQVVNFNPTVWHGNDFNGAVPDIETENRVIYCWGGTTSPFEYNERLFDLADNISSVWTTKLSEWQNGNTGNTSDGDELEAPSPYWKTLAEWSITTPPFLTLDSTAETETPELTGIAPWENYIGYNLLPAARNSFGNYHDGETKAYLCYNEYPFTTTKGIGIDCGGLVYMSISYNGCSYNQDMQEAHRVWLDTGEGNNNLHPIVNSANSYEITVDTRKEKTFRNLNLVKPGDIFYSYKGSFPRLYHVAIIQNINYPEDGRDLIPSDIDIIEATGFDSFGGVRNTSTLATLIIDDDEFNPKSWRIGRLQQGE